MIMHGFLLSVYDSVTYSLPTIPQPETEGVLKAEIPNKPSSGTTDGSSLVNGQLARSLHRQGWLV